MGRVEVGNCQGSHLFGVMDMFDILIVVMYVKTSNGKLLICTVYINDPSIKLA